jgi:L-ascorbate metabolism protein UlaG (beta-lactamase superfamily)
MENAVLVFNVDGVKVVDLGDAFGTMEDSQKLKELKDKIGNIDILMMPIGDPNCKKVDFNILQNTMNLMNPKVVFPIHYWNVTDKKEFSDNSSKLGYSIKDIKENYILVSAKELSSQNGKAIWNITPAKFSK